jgi:hypothetical protein
MYILLEISNISLSTKWIALLEPVLVTWLGITRPDWPVNKNRLTPLPCQFRRSMSSKPCRPVITSRPPTAARRHFTSPIATFRHDIAIVPHGHPTPTVQPHPFPPSLHSPISYSRRSSPSLSFPACYVPTPRSNEDATTRWLSPSCVRRQPPRPSPFSFVCETFSLSLMPLCAISVMFRVARHGWN